MHILIIEDEEKTAAYLKKGLNEHSFNVDLAHDGQSGLFQAKTTSYDLIILDVMLPIMDGWEVIKRIRKFNNSTPILFLTACDDVNDRVKGLELGADDYLVKPFAFSELLARVRTILRRGQAQQIQTLVVDDLEIDCLGHKAKRASKLINLTAKEFNLLSLLVRNKGSLMTRTMIAEKVWDMNFDSDTNVIDVAIRRLRQKIDQPFAKKLIHTVRGVGYVLEER